MAMCCHPIIIQISVKFLTGTNSIIAPSLCLVNHWLNKQKQACSDQTKRNRKEKQSHWANYPIVP